MIPGDLIGEQRIKHKVKRVYPHTRFCVLNSRKNISTANINGHIFVNIIKVFQDFK